VEGVLECVDEHFWTLAPGMFVGTLTVRTRPDANEAQVLAKVQNVRLHSYQKCSLVC
jgi:Co/Zn/Cd efflux system component